MDDAEIRAKGLDALYKALGPARAHHKFLAMFHREPNRLRRDLQKALRGTDDRRDLRAGEERMDGMI